jgi:hypothetical protein
MHGHGPCSCLQLGRRADHATGTINSLARTDMAGRSRRLFAAAQIVALTLLWSSSHLSAQARDRTPPTAPTNLMVVTTETSASLAWGPSTDNSGKFNYVIAGGPTNVTVSQTQTSHTLTGLQSGKTYIFRVRARLVQGTCRNPATR